MPLSGFLDTLTGARGVRRLGEQAERVARAQFDPQQLSPQLAAFSRMGAEGIGTEARDVARTGAVSQLFQPVDVAGMGVPQGAALAATQQIDAQRTGAMAGFERGLTEADIQARREGQLGEAQVQTQQRQLQAQSDAAVEQARMQTEAEVQRRRGALGATALGIAGTTLTTPFGAEGATLAQRGLQRLFGQEEADETTLADMARGISRRGVEGDVLDTEQALLDAEAGIEQFLPDDEAAGIFNLFADSGARPQVSWGDTGFMTLDEPDIPQVDDTAFDDRLEMPTVDDDQRMMDLWREYTEQRAEEIGGIGAPEMPWDTPGGFAGLRQSFAQLWRQINPDEQERFERWLERQN